MTSANSASYNAYQGFDLSGYPSYNQPFERCGCGQPSACGNEHKAAVQVKTVTRATRSGGTETVTMVAPAGQLHQNPAQNAFGVWDGNLALLDLVPRQNKRYQPPALPYICDRPVAGTSLCGMAGRCPP